jgi:hypothetical protein
MKTLLAIITLLTLLILGCDNGDYWVVNIESNGTWSADLNGRKLEGRGNYSSSIGDGDRVCCTVINRGAGEVTVWIDGGERGYTRENEGIIYVCGVK